VKESVQWTRNYDPTDGSRRYTFEDRDPEETIKRFQVVIYTEQEPEYIHESQSRRNCYYYGYVCDNDKECADVVGRFRLLKIAKQETLKLFNQYMVALANETEEEDAA